MVENFQSQNMNFSKRFIVLDKWIWYNKSTNHEFGIYFTPKKGRVPKFIQSISTRLQNVVLMRFFNDLPEWLGSCCYNNVTNHSAIFKISGTFRKHTLQSQCLCGLKQLRVAQAWFPARGLKLIRCCFGTTTTISVAQAWFPTRKLVTLRALLPMFMVLIPDEITWAQSKGVLEWNV